MMKNSHASASVVDRAGKVVAAPRVETGRSGIQGVAALLSSVAVMLAAAPAQATRSVASQQSPGAEPAPASPAPSTQPVERGSSAPAERTSGAVDTALYAGSVFDDPAPRVRKLGLMFDLGTMAGGMMSLVYRPLPYLRVHGGSGTNGAGLGLRVGAALQPVRASGWSLSLEGGHFFPGNVNGVFAAFAGSDYDDSHLLERFDYEFVNLQAGWEVERGDLLFFARAGVGFLWTEVPAQNLERIRNLSGFVDPDGSVEALLPSLAVGIIGFL